jgi:hypothetical protein
MIPKNSPASLLRGQLYKRAGLDAFRKLSGFKPLPGKAKPQPVSWV